MPSMENQYYQVCGDSSGEAFESLSFVSQSSDQQFSLIGEKLKTVGKLVMRIGNVGSVGSAQPSIESLKSKPTFSLVDVHRRFCCTASDVLRLLPTSRVISSTPPFDIVQERAGEITNAGVKDYRLTRAHRVVDSYPNLNTVLHNSVDHLSFSTRDTRFDFSSLG